MAKAASGGLPSVVLAVKDPVKEEEVALFGKLQDAKDKSYRIRQVIRAWKERHKEELALRKSYAWAIFGVVVFQLLFISGLVIAIGFKVIDLPSWVASTLVVAVFGELTAIILIVVKYLFPANSDGLGDLLGQINKGEK